MRKGLIAITIIALLAVLTIGCAGVPLTVDTPTEEKANLRLLVSDDPSLIEDFASLNVTITDIGLKKADEPGGWIYLDEDEFEPTTVDLTLLKSDNATEIFNGYVASGNYTKVVLYTENVTGELKSTDNGDELFVKLPSGKLQISKPFTLSDDMIVNFVFDITVIKAGNSDQYILKPQIDDSGPNQKFTEAEPKGKTEQHGKPEEQPESFEGTITAITDGTENASPWTMTLEGVQGDVTVYVTELEGTPSVGAKAEVEGTLTGNTIEDAKAKIKDEE